MRSPMNDDRYRIRTRAPSNGSSYHRDRAMFPAGATAVGLVVRAFAPILTVFASLGGCFAGFFSAAAAGSDHTATIANKRARAEYRISIFLIRGKRTITHSQQPRLYQMAKEERNRKPKV